MTFHTDAKLAKKVIDNCNRIARAEHVKRAIGNLDQGLTSDFLSINLGSAFQEMGTITVEITIEDVLDNIFSRFCIVSAPSL